MDAVVHVPVLPDPGRPQPEMGGNWCVWLVFSRTNNAHVPQFVAQTMQGTTPVLRLPQITHCLEESRRTSPDVL